MPKKYNKIFFFLISQLDQSISAALDIQKKKTATHVPSDFWLIHREVSQHHCFEIYTTWLTSQYMPSLSTSSLSNCAPVHYLYLILEMVILPLLILDVVYYTIYSICSLIMAFLNSLSLTFKGQMVFL